MSETIITNVSPATTTNCGVVKVGDGLSVTDDGTLSAKMHGNETWISTSFTFYGSGSWTVESSNTYEEIVSWFDNYDRVFATLVAGRGNTFEFGESFVELLKESSGSIVSMPINIKYETQLSTTTDELRVLMDDGMAFTTVTASRGNAPDTVTITWNGVSSSQNWERVDALYKAGKRLQVLSTEWDGEYILPLVSVISQGNNLYIFSAHYSDGRRAVVKFWHDPSIPDGSPQKEIFSEISDYPVASKTSLGVIKVGSGLNIGETTGTLNVNVDNSSIGITEAGGLYVMDKKSKSITVSNQPSSGMVSALYNGDTVCVRFTDIMVSGHAKTKVGQMAAAYAPSVKTTGTLAGVGANDVLTAYCQVDTDGSIYINPVQASGTNVIWTGTLTYLI